MSNTPLIEIENIKKHAVRKEKYRTYALIETEFQGWKAKLEAEWNTDNGELNRYWLKITNPADENRWKQGEVDGNAEDLFGKITSFKVHFSGFGAIDVPTAKQHLDTLNVSLAIAEELERRLNSTGFPMPKVEEFDKTVWLVGKPEKRKQ